MKIRNKPTSDNLSPKFEVRMGKISAIMSIYTKKKPLSTINYSFSCTSRLTVIVPLNDERRCPSHAHQSRDY